MSLNVEPANGMVAVEFLGEVENDDDSSDQKTSYSSPPSATVNDSYRKACFAVCLGVGKTTDGKAVNYKRGDTLIVRESAREYGIEIADDGCLISQYDVLGRVKT